LPTRRCYLISWVVTWNLRILEYVATHSSLRVLLWYTSRISAGTHVSPALAACWEHFGSGSTPRRVVHTCGRAEVEHGVDSICILSHSWCASATTWDVEFHTEATNMKNLDRIRKQLPAARRRRIAARAATLMAEEKSLQELRQARKLTQKRIAEVLGVGQDSVSRLEQRSDLLISTLRGYVEALGGRLSLVAEFPDRDPVILYGIAADM